MLQLDPFPYTTAFLAQGEGGPDLGGGGAPPGGGNADGSTTQPAGGGGGGAAPPGGGMESMWIIMLVFLVVLIAWTTMRSRRDQKKREAMLGSIRKRDTVQTVGGVIGTVVELNKNTVVLKVDEASNTRMTFARSALQQRLDESEPDKDEKAELSDTT